MPAAKQARRWAGRQAGKWCDKAGRETGREAGWRVGWLAAKDAASGKIAFNCSSLVLAAPTLSSARPASAGQAW